MAKEEKGTETIVHATEGGVPVTRPAVKSIAASLPKWIWALIIPGVFFAFLGLFLGMVVLAHGGFKATRESRPDHFGRGGYVRQDEGFGMRGGMMSGHGGPMMRQFDSGTSSRMSGVVTAVDGDMITVAGNGVVQKVKTTSTTEYGGDDKPAKVNDSIVVFGAVDGDVLTANTVRLMRQ